MKIARSPKKRTHNQFVFLVLGITGLGLLLIAAGLLQYEQMIDRQLAYAQTLITPKQYLYQETEKRGLDYDLLYNIIDCESNWRMVKNSTSSAYGFFQILDRTEKYTPQYKRGERKTDPFTNIDMGIYLYMKYGTSPWLESRNCWVWR